MTKFINISDTMLLNVDEISSVRKFNEGQTEIAIKGKESAYVVDIEYSEVRALIVKDDCEIEEEGRDFTQSFDPIRKQWVKVDIRKGEIVGRKNTPWKNVRHIW